MTSSFEFEFNGLLCSYVMVLVYLEKFRLNFSSSWFVRVIHVNRLHL